MDLRVRGESWSSSLGFGVLVSFVSAVEATTQWNKYLRPHPRRGGTGSSVAAGRVRVCFLDPIRQVVGESCLLRCFRLGLLWRRFFQCRCGVGSPRLAFVIFSRSTVRASDCCRWRLLAMSGDFPAAVTMTSSSGDGEQVRHRARLTTRHWLV